MNIDGISYLVLYFVLIIDTSPVEVVSMGYTQSWPMFSKKFENLLRIRPGLFFTPVFKGTPNVGNQ